MINPEETYKTLSKKGDNATEEEVNKLYDSLKPITPEFLIGSWKGSSFLAPFNTEHPGHAQLYKVKWAGKDFLSTEDVNPIMLYGEDGKRVWGEAWGHARLRKVEFRGVVSTAMIYDILPIIDSFRYVDEDTVAGLMDARGQKPYHFFLERLSTGKNGNL